MVETMRMHPSLIVSCKDVETSANRYIYLFTYMIYIIIIL